MTQLCPHFSVSYGGVVVTDCSVTCQLCAREKDEPVERIRSIFENGVKVVSAPRFVYESDEETGSWYLATRGPIMPGAVSRSVVVAPSLVVDLDAHGQVLGVEWVGGR